MNEGLDSRFLETEMASSISDENKFDSNDAATITGKLADSLSSEEEKTLKDLL